MSIRVVLGAQWGDEGKGKIVSYFSKNFDICARFQGGQMHNIQFIYQERNMILE